MNMQKERIATPVLVFDSEYRYGCCKNSDLNHHICITIKTARCHKHRWLFFEITVVILSQLGTASRTYLLRAHDTELPKSHYNAVAENAHSSPRSNHRRRWDQHYLYGCAGACVSGQLVPVPADVSVLSWGETWVACLTSTRTRSRAALLRVQTRSHMFRTAITALLSGLRRGLPGTGSGMALILSAHIGDRARTSRIAKSEPRTECYSRKLWSQNSSDYSKKNRLRIYAIRARRSAQVSKSVSRQAKPSLTDPQAILRKTRESTSGITEITFQLLS